MSCITFFGPMDRRVSVTSTTEVFVPMTVWMPAQGINKVRATLRLLAESGNIQARIAYQSATAVVNEGGAGGRNTPQGLGTATNATMSSLEFQVSAGDVHWIRFGVLVSLSQAGPPGQADVVASAGLVGVGGAQGVLEVRRLGDHRPGRGHQADAGAAGAVVQAELGHERGVRERRDRRDAASGVSDVVSTADRE